MWNRKNNIKLREKLRSIVEDEKNHGDNVGNQINLIKSLSNEIPHTIELIEEAKVGDGNSWRYNCFMFTFGLRGKPIKTQYILQDIFPNSKFAQFLVTNHLSEITLGNVQNNDYAIYFDNNSPTHAGKISNDKIVSKWGTAHRWSHGLFEIPSDYGNTVKFFRQLNEQQIFEIFNQWAPMELDDKLLNKN